MESRVVWTVDLRNSLVLSWRKNPPLTTLANTIMDQNTLRYTLESDFDCNIAAQNCVPMFHLGICTVLVGFDIISEHSTLSIKRYKATELV